MANTNSRAENVDETKTAPAINAGLYTDSHLFTQTMNRKILDLFQMSFGRRPTASQQFIDLGCGPGDSTREDLLPRCQPCRRIVATDISRQMIEYAEKHFAHPQIAYEVHDVESDISGLVQKYGKFERVYSFMALNWARDTTAAYRNVAGLMTDDGECLLVVAARVILYRVWRRIVELDRWKKYKKIVERSFPPTQDMEDRSSLLSYMHSVLASANLKPYTCEVLSINACLDKLQPLIEASLPVMPILPLLSDDLKLEFKSDVANVVRTFQDENPAGGPQRRMDIFIVHARKI
ncbi:juvenile hormone acid O-methyltransferase-like [Ixodes scapularis]|uniref:juvenile hormone acid O-methyltransferase-like n=1 Tax=Ixodes scapularis TaxID=6945 RepID=UPI001A9F5E99|nr:juvenile hormone acid O-methyltransferase-like [Ixodes scapularis]